MSALDPLDLLAVGEAMGLVVSDRPGRLRRGDSMTLSFGGAESNVAVAASRLGARSAWVSRLGDDSLALMIRTALASEGIEVLAATDPERPTGLMVKERTTPLRQSVSYVRRGSAASALDSTDVPDDLLARARCVVASGVTLALDPKLPEVIEDIFIRARQLGAITVLDLNYRPSLWPKEQAKVAWERVSAHTSMVFSGVDECAVLDPGVSTLEDSLKVLSDWGCDVSVVTDGARGAIGRHVDEVVAVDAVFVPVIDTVGAGDAFVGGFLAEWLAGGSLRQSMTTAAEAGAHACMFSGDWEGSPTREDLIALRSGAVVVR